MLNPSTSHDLSDKQPALELLANALAAGFTDVARISLPSTSTASCVGMDTTSLRAQVKSDSRVTGLEICFDSGIRGSGLILLQQSDLTRLAGLLAGMDCAPDAAIAPEIMEACVQFIADAVDATGRSLAKSHGFAVHATAPDVINQDGCGNTLLMIADAYSDAAGITLRLSMEGHQDSRILFLAHADLLVSLNSRISNCAAAGPSGPAALPSEVSMMSAQGEHTEKQNGKWNIDLILDVDLEVVVSFGETQMPLRDILKLGVGSVVELEKGVNDPVTIMVNEKPIARGEVVMVDGNYGVKVLEVESTADRIRSLG